MSALQIVELIIVLITLLIALFCLKITLQTKRRYEKIALKLGAGEDFTKILDKYIQDVESVKNQNDQIAEYCTFLDKECSESIKKVGLVKYDAFINTKNKLSFALALLNRDNTGIVINSIYGVDSSNVYTKPITKGSSKFNLTAEEVEAIKIASEK